MEIKFTYLQFTLYLCVVRSLSATRGVSEGENRGGKFRRLFFSPLIGEISPLDFLPQILLESRSNCAQHTIQGELKVGMLYFHNNSSILRFLRNGQIPNTKSYNGLHFASFAIYAWAACDQPIMIHKYLLTNLFEIKFD